MVQVKIGTNLNRKTVIEDENQTIRTILEKNEVNYESAAIHLDGATLQPGQMDKTLKDMGITEKCYLLAVVKADNATNK